jgi:hypothetical protein
MSTINLSIITVGLSEFEIFNTLSPLSFLSDHHSVEFIAITPHLTTHLLDCLPFVHFYSDEEKGVYQAMNQGLNKAQGLYLWFLNAGDQSLLNSRSSLLFLSSIATIIDHSLSPRDLPVLIFGSRLASISYLAPLGRALLCSSCLSLGMPFSHQNIIIPRILHPPFTNTFCYSSDYYLLNHIIFLNSSKILFVSNSKIAMLASGGISDLNRFAVFRERLQISLAAHHVSAVLIIFPSFVFRILRELLARLAKKALHSYRHLITMP